MILYVSTGLLTFSTCIIQGAYTGKFVNSANNTGNNGKNLYIYIHNIFKINILNINTINNNILNINILNNNILNINILNNNILDINIKYKYIK